MSATPMSESTIAAVGVHIESTHMVDKDVAEGTSLVDGAVELDAHTTDEALVASS